MLQASQPPSLTFVDSIANVASPPPLVDKVHERVYICAALPTPHNRGALYDWQVTEILERVDHDSERQARLFQYRLGLRDLKEEER
jgi:hypothetical protein